ncbi:hypothetical protein D3C73_1241600 [compost metagenome]
MAVAVPFEVEALPAGLEERVEAHVVVLVGTFDLAGAQQILAFGADFLPMVLQRAQVRELGGIEERLVGFFREQIKEAIDRRQE